MCRFPPDGARLYDFMQEDRFLRRYKYIHTANRIHYDQKVKAG